MAIMIITRIIQIFSERIMIVINFMRINLRCLLSKSRSLYICTNVSQEFPKIPRELIDMLSNLTLVVSEICTCTIRIYEYIMKFQKKLLSPLSVSVL